MPQLLSTIPTWFLILAVVLLGSLFIRAMNHSFGKLEKTIDRFEMLIDKIFDKHEMLENRVSKLEGEHSVNHKI